jgi:integrase
MHTDNGNGVNVGALADLERILEAHPNLLALLRDPAKKKKELTVGEVIERYKEAWKLDRPTTQEHKREKSRNLADFAKKYGDRLMSEVNGADLVEWIRSHKSWTSSWTRRRASGSIKAAFKWACDYGVCSHDPFTRVSFEQGDPGTLMTPKQYQALLRNTDACFRRVLVFLRWTGCRPRELVGLEWSFLDQRAGCFRLPLHKTARKGKKRTIVLPARLVKLVDWIRRHRRHPKYVFTCARWKWDGIRKPEPWTASAIFKRMRRLRKKAGIPKNIALYGLRRLFATQSVMAGNGLSATAALLGNTAQTCERHYAQIGEQFEYLHAATEKACAGTARKGPLPLPPCEPIPQAARLPVRIPADYLPSPSGYGGV